MILKMEGKDKNRYLKRKLVAFLPKFHYILCILVLKVYCCTVSLCIFPSKFLRVKTMPFYLFCSQHLVYMLGSQICIEWMTRGEGREKSVMLMVASIWGTDTNMQRKKKCCFILKKRRLWDKRSDQHLLNQGSKFKWCHRAEKYKSLPSLLKILII